MRTPLCKALAGVGLLATVIANGAYAATTPDTSPAAAPAKRPKICLALSGGGARGAAHIGVLKVLEQYRVPIDCIAGTSMGSIVGAAYATGMTIEEMDQITRSITTELIVKENPPREELSMERKSEDYTLLFGPEIGLVGKKFKFPKGVVTGVQLETVLRKLSKVKGFQRFDDLAIPFRAVATDLVTGKAVVFKEGELANVMRASMSVPGAVAPAEFGGMILVDGMLTENLPVQVARSMGADIVIAVNVGTPLLKRDQLDGIFGVAGQMVSILTEQNVQASIALLKPTDLLISPELGNYTTADFDELPKIALLGEPAARKVATRLEQFSLPPDAYAALRRRQTVAQAPDLKDRRDPDRTSEAGQPESGRCRHGNRRGPADQPGGAGPGHAAHLRHRRFRACELHPDRHARQAHSRGRGGGKNLGAGLRALRSRPVERFHQPVLVLQSGGQLPQDLDQLAGRLLAEHGPVRVQQPHRQRVLPTTGCRRHLLCRTQYQLLDPAHLHLPGPEQHRELHHQFGPTRPGRRRQFKRYGELRVGLVGGALTPQLETGSVVLAPDNARIPQGAINATLRLDRLDSVHFPRSGWRFGADVFSSNTGLGAEQSYNRWVADGTAAYSMGDHTINLAFKAGGKLGSDPLPAYSWFQWGGFQQQSGYKTGQLLANSMTYGRIMYYHRIMRGTMLDGAYGGVSLEAGRYGVPLLPDAPTGLLTSGSIFVGADTPIGPAYLGYGRAADGNQSFYFFLGRPF
jgi:NTE family protein